MPVTVQLDPGAVQLGSVSWLSMPVLSDYQERRIKFDRTFS